MTATLPAIMTSVARLIPSTRDSRQPYKLSNLDLVTESLTLIAGKASLPSLCIWYRRCTPVVVSSVTPLIAAKRLEYQSGSFFKWDLIALNKQISSSERGLSSSERSFSARVPRCNNSFASPPSSRIMFEKPPSVHSKIRCVNSQYSSRFAPLNANTGVPPAAIKGENLDEYWEFTHRIFE